jgi:flagellar hook-length control protein FliK
VILLTKAPKETGSSPLSLAPTGKGGEVDAEAFGKILNQLSLSLGGGKGLSKEEVALLLAKNGKAQETPLAPGLMLKLDPKAVAETAEEKPGSIKDGILALLKGGEDAALTAEEIDDITMLSPKLLTKLDAKEVKQLIQDAKAFLKEQLNTLMNGKELPTTLKGLVKLAEEKGLNLTKISVEQIQAKTADGKPVNELKIALPTDEKEGKNAKKQPLFATKEERTPVKPLTTQELVQNKQSVKRDATADAPADAPDPLNNLLQKKTVAEVAKGEKRVTETVTGKPVVDKEVKAAKTDVKADPVQQNVKTDKQADKVDAPVIKEQKVETAAAKTQQPQQAEQVAAAKTAPKAEPAVKTEARQESAATRAEQNLQMAQSKHDAANHQGGGNSGQQQGGNAAAQQAQNLTAAQNSAAGKSDFSASLNQLLHGETAVQSEGENRSSESQLNKAMQSQQLKENLDVKINEARQTVKHFAGEVREAIQNYKPPFTRIKIQLNPVKLGEVELTMVQRGNNVHINVSSNSAALNILAQNAGELRQQLAQNGFNNATMNFNSNTSGQEQQQSQQSQQQQQQQRERARELYEQFENNPDYEVVENLEIIIPNYA